MSNIIKQITIDDLLKASGITDMITEVLEENKKNKDEDEDEDLEFSKNTSLAKMNATLLIKEMEELRRETKEKIHFKY